MYRFPLCELPFKCRKAMHRQEKCLSLKPYDKLALQPNSDIIKISDFYILVHNIEAFVVSIKEALGSEPQGPVLFTNPYIANFTGVLSKEKHATYFLPNSKLLLLQ